MSVEHNNRNSTQDTALRLYELLNSVRALDRFSILTSTLAPHFTIEDVVAEGDLDAGLLLSGDKCDGRVAHLLDKTPVLGHRADLGVVEQVRLLRYWWVAIKLALNIALTALVPLALQPNVEDAVRRANQFAATGAGDLSVGNLMFPPSCHLSPC